MRTGYQIDSVTLHIAPIAVEQYLGNQSTLLTGSVGHEELIDCMKCILVHNLDGDLGNDGIESDSHTVNKLRGFGE